MQLLLIAIVMITVIGLADLLLLIIILELWWLMRGRINIGQPYMQSMICGVLVGLCTMVAFIIYSLKPGHSGGEGGLIMIPVICLVLGISGYVGGILTGHLYSKRKKTFLGKT